MLKKRFPKNYSTPKRPRLQKTRWVLGWFSFFIGLVVISALLAPVLVASHPEIVHFLAFFERHSAWFYLGHALFISSTYWWWPAYIRARGKRNQWPQIMIERACQWKWAVILMLTLLAVLFLF